MEISDVRVRLAENPSDRLKAFCTMTLGEVFVIRDLKIVEGSRGLFVAMPSRRVMVPCKSCGHRNHLRARFCNDCGCELPPPPITTDEDGRTQLHRDIAHPITTEFRQLVQGRVMEAYEKEAGLSGVQQPEADPEHEGRPQRGARPEHERSPEPEVPRTRKEPAVSEYDSLIADLKGAPSIDSGESAEIPTPKTAKPRGRERAPSPASTAAPEQDERGRRRRGRRPRRTDKEPRTEPALDEQPVAGPPKGDDRDTEASGTPDPVVEDDRQIVDAVPEPVRTPAPEAPEAGAESKSEPVDQPDDAVSFGAGIL